MYLLIFKLFTFADSITEYHTAFALAPLTLSANSQFFLCTAKGLIALSAFELVSGILPSFKNLLKFSFWFKTYVIAYLSL